MSRAELIYPIGKGIERELSKIETDPHNREILTRYFKVKSGQVSAATILENMIRLNVMSRMLNKKFEDTTVQEIEDLIFKIDQLKNSDCTKNKYRSILKLFYRWLRGFPKTDYPPEVRWIIRKRVPMISVQAGDLISYDEAIRITECALHIRDKALLQCKIDGGCRIGEILTVKVGEVRLNDAGAVLYSDGKTGYKPIILTWAAKTLVQWLNIHPFRNDPEAPVFCQLYRKTPLQLSYAAAVSALKESVRKAGITKRIWLHLLRHVSCTEDSARGMPDSYRKYKHHWSPNSKMPAVYEHLSQSIIPKIQNETWKMIGGSSRMIEEDAPVQLVISCRRCDFENPRDSKFCNRCGLILDEAELTRTSIAKAKAYAFIDRLAEDPKKLEKFLSMIP